MRLGNILSPERPVVRYKKLQVVTTNPRLNFPENDRTLVVQGHCGSTGDGRVSLYKTADQVFFCFVFLEGRGYSVIVDDSFN